MNEKCSSLNYESRSQTALKLAICHLKQSGVNNIDEKECNLNIKQCIAGMSISNQIAFSTYNHFFTSIDNMCIYIQMTENNKNIQKSIYNLYTATIQSTDYLIETNEQNKRFQNEILGTQNEIKKTNEEIINFNIKHEQNINNIQTISSNIENKQNNIFNKQQELSNKQNEIFSTVTNIENTQDTLLQNQAKSIEKQENIYSMQNKFGREMNKMYSSQFNEINAAKNEINKLRKDSRNAYKQIMDMINDALYILNMIYKMDFKMFQQLISIQSVTFYLFWCIVSYICTIPKCSRSVRLLSFISILISIIFEKTVVSIIPMDIITKEKNFYAYENITEWCVIIRQTIFGLNVLLFIWFVSTYKDPVKQQIQLLKEINIKTQNISRNKSKRVFFMSAIKSITPQNIRGLWRKL